ncbi:DDE-type integrase/transposase/recombinase [Aldersonia sp. NBC_00410]|uniref:DDE-type integrase/transposase/recombinase n=1 Tax=Aldersonia sp. NBC_00410 TaxID=2975954 RepID=UPI00339004EB
MYLCAIKDEYSKRVVGWSVADHMRTELVTDALERAVRARGGDCTGIILRSDRGSHYTAGVFERACARFGLRRSMTFTVPQSDSNRPLADLSPLPLSD